MIEVRKSEDRGHANHGWLDSYHTFSFGDYYDPTQIGFGPLRVINEDWIDPGTGFGTHAHRDMEIITYVLEGELGHKDSMGNGSVIHPGNVQRMSAGTGVRHSEFNHSTQSKTHLLQIWIEPDVSGVKPGYDEKNFDAAQKRGQLRLVASPDGRDGSVTINQDAKLYVGLFDGGEHARISIPEGRRAYLHVARGSISVSGVALKAGDAIKFLDETEIELDQGRQAKILLFALP